MVETLNLYGYNNKADLRMSALQENEKGQRIIALSLCHVLCQGTGRWIVLPELPGDNCLEWNPDILFP